MKLLINEPPLQILQSLALKGGLNEAILLLQLFLDCIISKINGSDFRGFTKYMPSGNAMNFHFG